MKVKLIGSDGTVVKSDVDIPDLPPLYIICLDRLFYGDYRYGDLLTSYSEIPSVLVVKV